MDAKTNNWRDNLDLMTSKLAYLFLRSLTYPTRRVNYDKGVEVEEKFSQLLSKFFFDRRTVKAMSRALGCNVTVPLNQISTTFSYLHEALPQCGVTSCFKPEPGDTVVDCGAFLGTYTLLALQRMKGKGMVLAIEPSPYNYAILASNVADFRNVIPVNLAVTNYDGNALFYCKPALDVVASLRSDVTSSGAIRLRTRKLDTLCHELKIQPSWIKIDVEGCELEVLQGARAIMSKFRPKLIIEVHECFGISEDTVIQYLAKQGYDSTVITRIYPYKGGRMGHSYLFCEHSSRR